MAIKARFDEEIKQQTGEDVAEYLDASDLHIFKTKNSDGERSIENNPDKDGNDGNDDYDANFEDEIDEYEK